MCPSGLKMYNCIHVLRLLREQPYLIANIYNVKKAIFGKVKWKNMFILCNV